MKKLIIANWKCNPTSLKEAEILFNSVKSSVSKIKNSEVIICPPFVYLQSLKGLNLGAQDVFYKEQGAFTGEISPLMLRDLGVDYAIVGHSERRSLGETDDIVNKKVRASLDSGLKPILCVGEKDGEDKQEIFKTLCNLLLNDFLFIFTIFFSDAQNWF